MSRLLSVLRRLRAIEVVEPYTERLLSALMEETHASRIAFFGAHASERVHVGAPAGRAARSYELRSGPLRIVVENAAVDDDATEIAAMEVLSLLDRARAARESKRTARQIALLDRVMHAASEAVTVADVADRAARALSEAIDGVHVSLHVVLGDRLELFARRYADGTSRLEGAPDWFRGLRLDEESLPARAFRERRLIVVELDELPERARLAVESEGEGVERIVFAPLVVGESGIGVLSVALRRTDSQPNDDRLRLIEDVAARLGGVLAHVRLLEEERKRSRDLALINEIGGVVAQHLDLDAVLTTAVRELARVIEVPRAVISLVDDEGKLLTAVACNQPGHPVLSVPVDGPGTVALAFRTARPVLIEDTSTDDRSMKRFAKTLGTRALFAVPLIASGRPIGTILLAEDRGVRRFTEDEVARATAVANLISPAIANAKMFADLRRSYDALSHAQAELVTSERLAALGELSAVIAHEVRNPLAIIFNSLGALRRVAATTEDARALLDIVAEEADRLNRIVADLLDFVRPYASHPRPTNVEALVRGAIDGARRSPSAVNAVIEADLGPFDHELLLDATMLQQALINLITNAIQVTPPGGRVTVRAHALAAGDGPARMRFDVADQGPGIAPADAARIFEPFFTTKPTGTGLGLAVVSRIADALSGTVEVTCGEQGGTVFTLTVPLANRC